MSAVARLGNVPATRSQAAEADVTHLDEFTLIGTGLTVFEQPDPVVGPVIWLDSPEAVLNFVSSGDVKDTIVLARGGTTTFLTPALSAGVKGVLTLQGAPQSHLGILSREYGIPCLMSVAFTEGVRSARGEVIPPDGATVRIDVSGSPHGSVSIAVGDRNYSADVAPVAADPEAAAQAAQLAALMAAYRGEIANGSRGDRQMRVRARTGVLDLDLVNIARELSEEEIADFLSYCGWNLWDLIAARSTEGESGLIPRQEYETISFVQQWGGYAKYFEQITERIGVDGIVELGRLSRDEIGTKANFLHLWAAGVCPLLGKGIAGQLGLSSGLDDRRNANTIIQFCRRMQYGLWGDGPGFVSSRGYQAPLLREHWLERFADEETRLDEPEALAAFRAFNAATELTGFLFHYDCRAGLCDTGPYPLPGGGFVIVRDHFLHDPAYEWASVLEGLPHAVTQAMFFRPDTPVEISINDIATTFANPKNYLQHLSGVAVYARDRWDTPVAEVRRLGSEEMASIVGECNAAMLRLYADIAALSWDERIRNGVKVYTRDMMLPYARPTGLWDSMLAAGFDELNPLAEQAYPLLTSGSAAPVLGAVFLLGHGLVPDSGLAPPPAVGPEALPDLHAIAVRGAVAECPETLLDAELVVATPSGHLLTERGRARHAELLAAERERLDLAVLEAYYERFLNVNEKFKAACARPNQAEEDRIRTLGDVTAAVERCTAILTRASAVLPRFAGYQARLTEALDRAELDWRWVAHPGVDSVHTVWMELHEDWLLTLGRSREAEGSY